MPEIVGLSTDTALLKCFVDSEEGVQAEPDVDWMPVFKGECSC